MSTQRNLQFWVGKRRAPRVFLRRRLAAASLPTHDLRLVRQSSVAPKQLPRTPTARLAKTTGQLRKRRVERLQIPVQRKMLRARRLAATMSWLVPPLRATRLAGITYRVRLRLEEWLRPTMVRPHRQRTPRGLQPTMFRVRRRATIVSRAPTAPQITMRRPTLRRTTILLRTTISTMVRTTRNHGRRNRLRRVGRLERSSIRARHIRRLLKADRTAVVHRASGARCRCPGRLLATRIMPRRAILRPRPMEPTGLAAIPVETAAVPMQGRVTAREAVAHTPAMARAVLMALRQPIPPAGVMVPARCIRAAAWVLIRRRIPRAAPAAAITPPAVVVAITAVVVARTAAAVEGIPAEDTDARD
jgi:hypothetical protein